MTKFIFMHLAECECMQGCSCRCSLACTAFSSGRWRYPKALSTPLCQIASSPCWLKWQHDCQPVEGCWNPDDLISSLLSPGTYRNCKATWVAQLCWQPASGPIKEIERLGEGKNKQKQNARRRELCGSFEDSSLSCSTVCLTKVEQVILFYALPPWIRYPCSWRPLAPVASFVPLLSCGNTRCSAIWLCWGLLCFLLTVFVVCLSHRWIQVDYTQRVSTINKRGHSITIHLLGF